MNNNKLNKTINRVQLEYHVYIHTHYRSLRHHRSSCRRELPGTCEHQ